MKDQLTFFPLLIVETKEADHSNQAIQSHLLSTYYVPGPGWAPWGNQTRTLEGGEHLSLQSAAGSQSCSCVCVGGEGQGRQDLSRGVGQPLDIPGGEWKSGGLVMWTDQCG